MSQKIETIISADNSKFVQAISDTAKAANDAANTLSAVAKNANEADKAITSAAENLENTADSAQKAADALEAAADATGSLKEGASKATEALTITIDGMDAAEKKAKDLAKASAKNVKEFEETQKAIQAVQDPMKFIDMGFKDLAASMKMTGGQAAVLCEGLKAVIKIVKFFSEQAQEARQNLAEFDEYMINMNEKVFKKNEQLRQQQESELKTMAKLADQEKLTNVQKLQQIELLEELRYQYEALENAAVNAAGQIVDADGKIIDMHKLVASAADDDKEATLAEIYARIEGLKKEKAHLEDVRKNIEYNGDKNLYKQTSNKIADVDQRILDYELQARMLGKQSSPGEDYLAQKKAERQDEIQAGIDKLKEDDQDKTLSTFEKQRKDLWRKLKPLFNNNELTDDQFKELVALKAKAEQRIKEAEILEMQKKEAEEQEKMEAEAAKERAAAEQYAKQRMAVEKKINDLLDEQKKRRLSQYD